MVKTASTMLPLGTTAPDFSLPDGEGKTVNLNDLAGDNGLLVLFICNHCPFVKYIGPKMGEVCRTYQEKGIAVVGINANDADTYPDDAPDKMVSTAKEWGFTFPYLVDADQSVAKAYHAACTPDIYLFDGDRRLVYRGQFDSARPGTDVPITGEDLTAAVDALATGQSVPSKQTPSIGCNIKWKPGNEPEYFG
jgi:peroxiredoxin